MSAQELASKIELLSEDDFRMVVMLVNRLSGEPEGLRKLSEDDLVEELTVSMKRSDAGHVKPAREVSREMRAKYAV